MTEAETAWVAGIFEGEGSVSAKSSTGGIQFKVAMCDEEVVRRWGDLIGCGHFRGPYDRGTSRPYYEYGVSTYFYVVEVYMVLKPWLSVRRREQIEKAIASSNPPLNKEARRRAQTARRDYTAPFSNEEVPVPPSLQLAAK